MAVYVTQLSQSLIEFVSGNMGGVKHFLIQSLFVLLYQ